ncbi:hypothetical protein [Fulvivirga lutimaris]|uniref:hypothetical protein n=1 Tax=Fulvivirga lutimaris TaxID=1819566 RepID=UPI0012BCBD53|nr:hypothetical protein [Fulvivirga lutimaris]MTI39280.1 hypothetical protein [Fulvivirga lutimaris]
MSCKGTNSFSTHAYWTEIPEISANENDLPAKFKAYNLDIDNLKLSVEDNNALEIPSPLGELLVVNIKSSSTMSPALAEKFPEILSYEVLNSETVSSGRIDINPSGFYAMIKTGSETYFINPVKKGGEEYVCYFKGDANENSKNPYFEQNNN